MLHVTCYIYLSSIVSKLSTTHPSESVHPFTYPPGYLTKQKVISKLISSSEKVWTKVTEMVYSALGDMEGIVRKGTATMTCLLAAGFFSLSLLLCYLKSLVGGRGWDGMAKV